MTDLRKTTGGIRLAMKAAVRRALTLAGGGESVQHATRVSAASLSRYASPDYPDQHCPIDVAMDIDLEAQQDVILAAWADARGYDLVQREPSAPPTNTPWCAKISAMVQQDGRVTSTLLEAIADGVVSPADARCIVPELDKEIDLLRTVRERVIAEAGQGGSAARMTGAGRS